MTGSHLTKRGKAQHREGLAIIEAVLGRGQIPIVGLFLYSATARMLDGVRNNPRFRRISPHLIGTPSILLLRPRISQSELARYLGCPRATAGKQVMACVRQGWVRRTRSTEDRRSFVLELTASGQRMLGEVADIVAQHEAATFATLSTKDRKVLRSLLLQYIAE